jgi:hypothetical protein
MLFAIDIGTVIEEGNRKIEVPSFEPRREASPEPEKEKVPEREKEDA